MNKRFEELAEHATRVDVTVDRFGGTEYTSVFDKEKFAELIVQECATVAEESDDTWTGAGPRRTGN